MIIVINRKKVLIMDDTLVEIMLGGLGLIGFAIMIIILQKTGILPKLINGEFWRQGQDAIQQNDTTF